MAKVRVSTTVDERLLAQARAAHGGNDASLLEAALTDLLRRHRRTEIDAAYAAAYASAPVNAPDEWGDLESWHAGVHAAGRQS